MTSIIYPVFLKLPLTPILKASFSYRTGVYRPYAIRWHIILGGEHCLCARELFLSNQIVSIHALEAATESQPTVIVTAASWYINAIKLHGARLLFKRSCPAAQVQFRGVTIGWFFAEFCLVLSEVCFAYSHYLIISRCVLALPWVWHI